MDNLTTEEIERLKNDYQEAAEFEARVARRLAFGETCSECKDKPRGCPPLRYTHNTFGELVAIEGFQERHILEKAECRLRHARLAIEEEMESYDR